MNYRDIETSGCNLFLNVFRYLKTLHIQVFTTFLNIEKHGKKTIRSQFTGTGAETENYWKCSQFNNVQFCKTGKQKRGTTYKHLGCF